MSRNVVLVTIDSLRADHCGLYGSAGIPAGLGSLTPTLDALAASGTTFETALAPGPRTPSSMPVAMTGEPLRGGGVYRSWPEKQDRWRERRTRIRGHMHRYRPLARRLRDEGYETGAVTANPWTTADTGFDVGFDRFTVVDGASGLGTVGRVISRAVGNDAWLLQWPHYYEAVRETIGSLADPFFLWVFLLDPHQPYLAPRPYRVETSTLGAYYANLRYNRLHSYVDDLPTHVHDRLVAAYRDTVRSVDGFLEQLCTDLPGGTRVVVHADHGEALADHGMYGHRPQLLFEENIRVPLVIGEATAPTHSGEELPVSDRIHGPVSLARLPTLVTDVARGTVRPSNYTEPYVRGRTEEGERAFVRGPTWKYVRGGKDWEYVYEYEGESLYDLEEDPGERHDVSGKYPDLARLANGLLKGREADLTERAAIAAGAVTVRTDTASLDQDA